MNFIRVIKFWALILACEIACTSAHDGYTQLELYLVRNVPSFTVSQNLQMIRQFLTSRERISGSSVKFDTSMMDALQNVDKLFDMTGAGIKCDLEERDQLVKLSEEVGIAHKLLTDQEVEGITRLRWIVYWRSMEHAQTCIKKYPSRVEERLSVLRGHEFVHLVDSFTEGLISKVQELSRSRSEHLTRLAEYESPPEPEFVEQAVKHLMAAAFKQPGRPMPQQTNQGVIFERFLASPCAQYVRTFGPDLFELASFDQEMFESIHSAYELKNVRLVPYFQAMVRYKICKAVAGNQDFKSKVEFKLGEHILAYLQNFPAF